MQNPDTTPQLVDDQEAAVTEMRVAYDELGEHPEECDVEVFFHAQREVVTREPA